MQLTPLYSASARPSRSDHLFRARIWSRKKRVATLSTPPNLRSFGRIVSRPFLKLGGICHGFEDPVVESFDLFVGITDHKFLLEVFEKVLFGLMTSKNQVGVVMCLFKKAFKGG